MKITNEAISKIVAYMVKSVAGAMDDLKANEGPIDPSDVGNLLGHIAVDMTTVLLLLKDDLEGATKWCKEHEGWGAISLEKAVVKAEDASKWPAISAPVDAPDADPTDPRAWN